MFSFVKKKLWRELGKRCAFDRCETYVRETREQELGRNRARIKRAEEVKNKGAKVTDISQQKNAKRFGT